ncbi:hypothetical protein DFH09DRAFT_1094810 [Mycena vulgaris]|nr:hypothetical protein DFH09DRAFT_1094810 [Mycena vulgaris]
MPNDRWPAVGALISMLTASKMLADISFHNFDVNDLKTDNLQPGQHAETTICPFHMPSVQKLMLYNSDGIESLLTLFACASTPSISIYTLLCSMAAYLPIFKLYLSQRPNPTTFKIFYYADLDNQKPSEAATLESMYQEFDLELKHWRWTED